MKTLYWNRTSDVQVSNENKKRSINIGIANIENVLNAVKKGLVREFKMYNGKTVGVSDSVWSDFVKLHDTDQVRENILFNKVPLI